MKIRAIELYELNVPLNKPFRRSTKIGTLVDCTPIICKLITDEGLEGIGETNPVMPLTCEDAAVVVHVIKKYLAPALLGTNPLNLLAAHRRMDQAASGWNLPKAALDLACHDLLGKKSGFRVADLLGGTAQERLPVMWTVGMDTPRANAEEAVAMQNQGFTSLMIKTAAGSVEEDARRVRAIREAVGPDYPLIVDANQGWDVLLAMRFARLTEKCGLALLEQPVAAEDHHGLAEIRRKTGLPISADESVHTLEQAKSLIEKQAVDVFSIKVIKHGGIQKTRAIMKYAEAHGILCLMNSNAEEGVTQAASLQLGAAATNLWPYGHAYRSPLRLAADISTFSDHIRNGWVSLPRAPGLGVELRQEVMERFLVRKHVLAC